MKRPSSPKEAREAAAARRKRRKAHRKTLASLPIGAPRCALEPPVAETIRAPEPATVHSTTARTSMQPDPRPRRIRSELYLAWVRLQPCALVIPNSNGIHIDGPNRRCTAEHGGSDPHHVRTRGAGGSDLVTIPVCRAAHDAIGAGRIDREKVEAALGRTLLLADRQPAAWWERVAREILCSPDRPI